MHFCRQLKRSKGDILLSHRWLRMTGHARAMDTRLWYCSSWQTLSKLKCVVFEIFANLSRQAFQNC
jgi:hypothetical protein